MLVLMMMQNPLYKGLSAMVCTTVRDPNAACLPPSGWVAQPVQKRLGY